MITVWLLYIFHFDGVRRLHGVYTNQELAQNAFNQYKDLHDKRNLLTYDVTEISLNESLQ
jgi:hypothetical protein